MKTILLLCLVLTAFHARAGVVFEQPHDGTGTLHHSSRYQPNGTDYDQFVWDSFSVPTAQAVTEIRWRGGYDPEMAYWGGNIVNFRVSIYESTPGLSQPLSGARLSGQTPPRWWPMTRETRPGETSAGVFGGVEMFDYHFTLPTRVPSAGGQALLGADRGRVR